ncbi:hypothetical protein [Nocardia sp. NPDC003963]
MRIHTLPGGSTAGAGLAELAARRAESASVPATLRAHLVASEGRKRGNFNSFIENKGNFNSFIQPGV